MSIERQLLECLYFLPVVIVLALIAWKMDQ